MLTVIQRPDLFAKNDEPNAAVGNFKCGRFRFVLEARTPLRLSTFAGSTLRGGFGHIFKRLVCTWRPGECQRCMLRQDCPYPYVFETAPPVGAEKLRGLDQIPRPYVIEPPAEYLQQFWPRTYRPGDRFGFTLVLVGRAISHLPHFVLAFEELGRVGMGPYRGRFRVDSVTLLGRDTTQTIYTGGDGVYNKPNSDLTLSTVDNRFPINMRWLRVQFQTPTRICKDGTPCSSLTFQDLIRALLRRLSSLCYFHCGSELELDFKRLVDRAANVRRIASDLRWHDQSRFSGRQHQRIEMGGVLGSATFQGLEMETFAPYLPLLSAGEWVHVGKGAVMGLGKYVIDAGE